MAAAKEPDRPHKMGGIMSLVMGPPVFSSSSSFIYDGLSPPRLSLDNDCDLEPHMGFGFWL